MTYLYFLLSLRSLYAVMHSGATVALGGGACQQCGLLSGPLLRSRPRARACVRRRPRCRRCLSRQAGVFRIDGPRGGRGSRVIEGSRRAGRGDDGEERGRTNPDWDCGSCPVSNRGHWRWRAHAGSTTITYHDERCERDESPLDVGTSATGGVRGWYLGDCWSVGRRSKMLFWYGIKKEAMGAGAGGRR